MTLTEHQGARVVIMCGVLLMVIASVRYWR